MPTTALLLASCTTLLLSLAEGNKNLELLIYILYICWHRRMLFHLLSQAMGQSQCMWAFNNDFKPRFWTQSQLKPHCTGLTVTQFSLRSVSQQNDSLKQTNVCISHFLTSVHCMLSRLSQLLLPGISSILPSSLASIPSDIPSTCPVQPPVPPVLSPSLPAVPCARGWSRASPAVSDQDPGRHLRG